MSTKLGNLVSDTLDKVKNNALTRAKDNVVSGISRLTDGLYANAMDAANKASGIVPRDGETEAAKRFEMYTLHTNRPKPSQQFYVLFEPRPIQDLYFRNYIKGEEAGWRKDVKMLGSTIGDWTKKKLRDWTSTENPDGTFTNLMGEKYRYNSDGSVTYIPDPNNPNKQQEPNWFERTGKKVADNLSSLAKGAAEVYSDVKQYLFGVADQDFLYKPKPYNPISTGWLSSFANRLDARAQIVEWGLFNNGEDDYNALVQDCDEVSMHCVDTDRPSWEIPVKRYNQYNRDRLVYEKVKYEPITMTFYDTIDSALLRLLLYQLAYINDSYLKSFSHFTEYTQLENFMNNPGNWGMNLFSNTGIFKSISIVEIWGDQCTVYNMMMPKITSVKLSRADATKSDVHKITIKFEYEGLTNYNPLTLSKNDYDIMIGWAMSDSRKAASIAKAVRLKYESSLQGLYNLSKSFAMQDGTVVEKLTNIGQRMGFGEEIKLASEITSAAKTGNLGGFVKQMTNPSSITSKIGRLF